MCFKTEAVEIKCSTAESCKRALSKGVHCMMSNTTRKIEEKEKKEEPEGEKGDAGEKNKRVSV